MVYFVIDGDLNGGLLLAAWLGSVVNTSASVLLIPQFADQPSNPSASQSINRSALSHLLTQMRSPMPAPTTYGSFDGEERRPRANGGDIVPDLPAYRVQSTRRMLAIVLMTGLFVILGIEYIATTRIVTSLASSPTLILDSTSNAISASQPASSPPTQVHVALADLERQQRTATEGGVPKLGVTISWATATQTQASIVKFGLSTSELSSVVHGESLSEQYVFCKYTSPWFHHVVIPSSQLKPSTTYYYQCGDEESGWSKVASFRTPVAVGSQIPVTIGVIGDLGQTMYSNQTLRHLASRIDMSAIVHAGDLSYADNNQERWDSWGNLVQPVASTMPWMVSAGNHEKERPCQAKEDPFVAYQERFKMPYDPLDPLQRGNLYFAFRLGMVHMIVLTPYVAFDASSDQYKWLKQELAKRVDRSVTPWVTVLMHGPWYNSNTAHQGMEEHVIMKKAMEDVLFQHQVDLVLAGHVHAYERSFPVYKEEVRKDGIIYVVLGGGGNREGLASKFIEPKPAWSAFRQAHYGFGLFKAVNATHGVIESYENQEVGDASLQDSAWVTTTSYRIANGIVDVNLAN